MARESKRAVWVKCTAPDFLDTPEGVIHAAMRCITAW